MNGRMCVRHVEVHCIGGTGVSEDSGVFGGLEPVPCNSKG